MARAGSAPIVLAAPPLRETRYFVRARTSLAEHHQRILKDGDTFGMFDQHGDIVPDGEAQGLYHKDTRHLSGFQLLIAGRSPLLLSSRLRAENSALDIDLTNPDISDGGEVLLSRDLLYIGRTQFIWHDRLSERLALRNYSVTPLDLDLDIAFAADFADIFEARGMGRATRGSTRIEQDGTRAVRFLYAGEDGCERTTAIRFDPPPDALGEGSARYRLHVDPEARASLFITVECTREAPAAGPALGFFRGFREARRWARKVRRNTVSIRTSNDVANEILDRSAADLLMLVTETATGPYPYAVVPWYSTAFGRDGLITALLMLWVDPALARGVLLYLAATQAAEEDPDADAEPGKILHETREGELSRLGVVPFRHYYGTIDATPLFVVLAGAYYDRTGDLETIKVLDPNIRRALEWMERYGDRDGDGLLEYGRRREDGLLNQGWKDSHDSISHASGDLASGPIALVEVQGYAFAAYRSAAGLARAVGRADEAAALDRRAETLRHQVEEAFWCERLGFYALALDGEKRRCEVRSSNAGHLLFSGLPSAERAAKVASQLLSPDFFTGFGIRTLARGEARYNPMSYHNGSVWPHDNALIALGLARYGQKDMAVRLMLGLFEAAAFMDLRRLPELFCGFRRVASAAPTLYPVACSPQSWASATPFALLQSALGLRFDQASRAINLDRPRLPPGLSTVSVNGLAIGTGSADIMVRRAGGGVAVNVVHRTGVVDVVVRH